VHVIIFIHFLKLGLKLLSSGRFHSAASLLMMRFYRVILVARRLLKLKKVLAALHRGLSLIIVSSCEAPFIKKLNSFDLVLLLHSAEVAMRFFVIGIR